MAALFLLLPESEISHPWMLSLEGWNDETAINRYIEQLKIIFDDIAIEEYDGYFDLNNIENFLRNFDILNDYYPYPVRMRLRIVLSSLYDWRDDIRQQEATKYMLFNQKLDDHTFCEVAQRKRNDAASNFLLISCQAHIVPSPINIHFDREVTSFISEGTTEGIRDWFIENRQPERDFHAIEKHGENRQEYRMSRRGRISPLKCSAAHAKTVLRKAVGDTKEELFGYDDQRNEFIVYKYEGDIGQNLYHGYHQPRNTTEVPEHIKEKLLADHLRWNHN